MGGVRWARLATGLVVVAAAGGLLVSGGSGADPGTPAGLPGLPPPFLGTAVVGSGGLTAAIDSYGDVVDLRPRPAGRALIDNPSDRQAAGSVPADTGIVPWVSVEGRPARPLWGADAVVQRYRPGTDVLVTRARFGPARVTIVYAAGRSLLACMTKTNGDARVSMRVDEPAAARRLRCDDAEALRIVTAGAAEERSWLGGRVPLSAGAPSWARRLYKRSLLVLHALTDRRSGAVAAGDRDGWSYVWPRDASAAAIAYAAAGYRKEAERAVAFLLGLELEDAARFHGDGSPVPGRAAQGDAVGWVAAASRAAAASSVALAFPAADRGGVRRTAPFLPPSEAPPWRNRADYQEGEPGDYLGNALAAGVAGALTADGTKTGLYDPESSRRLVRVPGDPRSGLDSAAAWAIEPFPRPSLYGASRRTMLALVRRAGRFGITPGTAWAGEDPWSAPTAWTAWSLAALAQREVGTRTRFGRAGRTDPAGLPSAERGDPAGLPGGEAASSIDRLQALRLLGDLRRAATPAGLLPERVDSRTGIPRSTTPLAWSHAFTILTLLELWPPAAPPPRTASKPPSGR